MCVLWCCAKFHVKCCECEERMWCCGVVSVVVLCEMFVVLWCSWPTWCCGVRGVVVSVVLWCSWCCGVVGVVVIVVLLVLLVLWPKTCLFRCKVLWCPRRCCGVVARCGVVVSVELLFVVVVVSCCCCCCPEMLLVVVVVVCCCCVLLCVVVCCCCGVVC